MTALVLLSYANTHSMCAADHRSECTAATDGLPNDSGTAMEVPPGIRASAAEEDAQRKLPDASTALVSPGCQGMEEDDIAAATPNGGTTVSPWDPPFPAPVEPTLSTVVERNDPNDDDGMDGALDELFAADDDEEDATEAFLPAQQTEEEDSASVPPERFATPESSPFRSRHSTALALWPLSFGSRSEWPLPSPWAGLDNLGNTCYLASALQLLASLPSFSAALSREAVTHGNTTLQKAFLDVMDQLQHQKGSVSPEAFKEALDDRTSLFLGYRQQDAHEFLTTLLDLLDEDYKTKPVAIPEEAKGLAAIRSEDCALERSHSHALDRSLCAKKQKTEAPISQDMDTEDTYVVVPSPQKTEEERSDESSSSYRSSMQSLSELDVNAIDRLLHGASNMDTFVPNITCLTSHRRKGGVEELLESEQPQYKLVGGRMNMTDVVLSPYDIGMEPDDGNLSSSRRMVHPTEQATLRVMEDDDAPMDASDEYPSEGVVSPIDAMFTTEVRVRLTCDSCKLSRSHKETFLHLSLEIGANTELCATSIEDSLRRFFAPCTQEVKCEKCFCETATQCFEITKLPPALLLHLKRFIVDYNGDWSSVTYRKNQADVHLNEDLAVDEEGGVLSEFLSSDCTVALSSNSIPSDTMQCCAPRKYVLRSVVNHIGSSANCGHYTADAQRGETGSKSWQWWRFNDSYVSSLSMDEVMEQSKQTAYLCLYVLSK
jgi:ubiquitin C-terminal hydrolase